MPKSRGCGWWRSAYQTSGSDRCLRTHRAAAAHDTLADLRIDRLHGHKAD